MPARAAATATAPPQLEAAEAILVETNVGARIYSLDPRRRVAIASTTKMMTAYVTVEHESLTQELVEQPYYAQAGESLAGLEPGVSYSVADMLQAMLLPSGNDAAHTLAVDVGGTVPNFVAEMNAAAVKLGLHNTHFATPVGLDTPGNYSTAADLAKLGEAVLRRPFLARVVREQVAYLPGGIVVENRNHLLGSYPFVVGIKTGHTVDAGWCLVGAASWHGLHFVSVVLGDPSEDASFDDTLALLQYGLSQYRRRVVVVAGHTYATVRVKGSRRRVALVAAHGATLAVRRSHALDVTLVGVPSRRLRGPIAAGTQEGAVHVRQGTARGVSVALVTQTDIAAPPRPRPRRGLHGALLYGVIGAVVALVLLVGCSLLIMRRRASGADRPEASN